MEYNVGGEKIQKKEWKMEALSTNLQTSLPDPDCSKGVLPHLLQAGFFEHLETKLVCHQCQGVCGQWGLEPRDLGQVWTMARSGILASLLEDTA